VIVVADTSPLNYLIRLGHVKVLHLFYGQVVVPPAVLTEMQHPDAPQEVRTWAAFPPAWLRQVSVQHLDESLTTGLGAGEREAISLALELHADVLLIDEFLGRQQAEARNILVTGTLTILLQASLRGYLNFPEELSRLRQLGFRASASIEATMLARYESAKKKS
jgi:predicted nucleic acid-binding protein